MSSLPGQRARQCTKGLAQGSCCCAHCCWETHGISEWHRYSCRHCSLPEKPAPWSHTRPASETPLMCSQVLFQLAPAVPILPAGRPPAQARAEWLAVLGGWLAVQQSLSAVIGLGRAVRSPHSEAQLGGYAPPHSPHRVHLCLTSEVPTCGLDFLFCTMGTCFWVEYA